MIVLVGLLCLVVGLAAAVAYVAMVVYFVIMWPAWGVLLLAGHVWLGRWLVRPAKKKA